MVQRNKGRRIFGTVVLFLIGAILNIKFIMVIALIYLVLEISEVIK